MAALHVCGRGVCKLFVFQLTIWEKGVLKLTTEAVLLYLRGLIILKGRLGIKLHMATTKRRYPLPRGRINSPPFMPALYYRGEVPVPNYCWRRGRRQKSLLSDKIDDTSWDGLVTMMDKLLSLKAACWSWLTNGREAWDEYFIYCVTTLILTFGSGV